jgi:RNA polymerase sigma-70 factor (ECF subfamily)
MNNANLIVDVEPPSRLVYKAGNGFCANSAIFINEKNKNVRSGVDVMLEPPDMNKLLAELALTRDKENFSVLFGYFAPRLKSMLLGLGSNAETAEELAQEAMLSVWRKCDMYDPSKAAASTWIFAIARNLRIDRFRKEKRPEFDPHDPALIPDPELMADDQLAITERQNIVKNALAELPSEQREVVKLSFLEGLSHQEIANKLQLPLGTVKSRVRLSFKKLKTKLRNQL